MRGTREGREMSLGRKRRRRERERKVDGKGQLLDRVSFKDASGDDERLD